ncbi:hypothetical protein [Paraburkholderia sp. SIMBA_054]|uniref:hypothetical protein n=1 Tax=Paraburkholderia sp. SIMBA_054 TaxID=3085795 RepID=UPI003978E90E
MASCLPYASTLFPGNRKSRMSPPALRLLIVQRSKRPEHKTRFSAQRFMAWWPCRGKRTGLLFGNSMLNRLHPARAMSDTLSDQSSYVLPVAKITEILAQNDTRPNVKEGGRRPQISAAAGSYSAVFRGCKPDEARSRPAP